jgi:hypothetical protein
MTWTAGNSFQLKFLTGANTSTSPFRELGFVSSSGTAAVDSSAATSVTSPYQVNLSLPLSWYIKISEFEQPGMTSSGVDYTFTLQIPVVEGEVMLWTENGNYKQSVNIPSNIKKLQHLNVRIFYTTSTGLNSSQTEVPLMNSEWEMILKSE